MTKIGYALSSEEYEAADLVRHAQAAETAGFDFAFISDIFIRGRDGKETVLLSGPFSEPSLK